VIGFHVYRTGASQKELNKLEPLGKSALHYLILVLAFIVPIFIVVSLVCCVKTPIPKRKWLWVFCILGGTGTISINWSTGVYELRLLQYQLLGAAAVASGEYAPWLVTAGFPLGAIIFWLKRNSFIEQSEANESRQQDIDKIDASA
jgi:hypothetical protein